MQLLPFEKWALRQVAGTNRTQPAGPGGIPHRPRQRIRDQADAFGAAATHTPALAPCRRRGVDRTKPASSNLNSQQVGGPSDCTGSRQSPHHEPAIISRMPTVKYRSERRSLRALPHHAPLDLMVRNLIVRNLPAIVPKPHWQSNGHRHLIPGRRLRWQTSRKPAAGRPPPLSNPPA
jgi:hypothetical protein